ncbi:hypothetical protein [Clostridium sp.]|uniref:hypothetical protein n=1 Tax=Clostridium sp. TaxID=1506 RepID=UPI003D6D40D6
MKDAIITINYNLELAYTMIVASIESLATEFDNYDTQWQDCLMQKNRRKRLDSILESIDYCYSKEIKDVIIEDTHARLGMRYRLFILKYISDKYYEERVSENILKCKESLLERAIKNSYQLRSSYIHALESMPNIIKYGGNSEVYSSNEGDFFTFSGIVRITKFVIKEFIYNEEKLEKEDIDYFNRLPGTIEVKLASEYWINKVGNYEIKTSKIYYQGLLEYISAGDYKEKGFILLEEICKKIEILIKFSEHRMDIVNKIIVKAYRENANDKYLEDIYYNLKNNEEFEVVKWHEHYILN